MNQRRPLPEPFLHAAFSTRSAQAAGVARSRLRSRDLEHPHRGVHVTASAHPLPPDPKPHDVALRRMQLLRPALEARHFFSQVSAAVFWRLPLPRSVMSGPLHVAVQWPARAPRIPGVVGHALRRPRVVQRDGWRVQTPTDAWCELSRTLGLDDLVAAGDALFYRQRKLATREGLAASIERWGRKPGGRLLREAFELIRENAESPKETEWRLTIIRAGFPEPVVNYPVYDSDGKLVAILDLALPQYQTGLDYDGRHHAEDRVQFARDGERYNALQRLGWHDIRIMAGMSKRAVLSDLRHRLIAKGWRP